jgi:hypothetical protein
MLFKIIKFIFIFILSIIIIYIGATFLDRDFAEGITKKKILILEPGMTKKRVVYILGKPLDITHYTKEQTGEDSDAYLYARSLFMGSGVEINVALVDGKLEGIGLELDDIYFYKCYEKDCPKIISPFLWKYLIPND